MSEASRRGGDEAERIVAASRVLSARGWAPAGSGNYSHRLADGDIAITVSGAHKARLSSGDVMTIDAEGRARDERRPSAETPLHLMIYRLYPEVRAVLHTHSIAAVALTRMAPGQGALRLAGYELLKAFPGVQTHDCAVDLPIFDNSQDMTALAADVAAALTAHPAPAFLVRGHGFYGWAASMDEALNVVEAAETMIACELELTRRERR
jgi:methylthioribulose-1-phosphate dehydratase